MTTTLRIAVVPRDGLFCKDGRGWQTSASGRGHSLDWPWPSTVLGALRSAWGRAEESRTGALFESADWQTRTATIRLGRSVVVRRQHGVAWNAGHPVWPVPSDALWLKGRHEVQRLEPVPAIVPTLGRDDDPAREGLMRPSLDDAEKPLVPPKWWSNDDFVAWLAGRSVLVRAPDDALALSRRVQAHVGIRAEELTSEEGVLFSHDVVETLEPNAEWAIGLEVILPGEELSDVAMLGSDSRLVRMEPLPELLFEPPARVLDAFRATSAGLRIVTVTPACFERGWLPDGIARQGDTYCGHVAGLDSEVILRAAFVPRPLHVSGWDMAAGKPKPTSRMVAPGAVYFFERKDGRPFGEADARTLWLSALGVRTDEGFGRVVPGVWSPTRSIT